MSFFNNTTNTTDAGSSGGFFDFDYDFGLNGTQLSGPTFVNDTFSEDFNDTLFSNPTVVNDAFSEDFNGTQLSGPIFVNDTFSEDFNGAQLSGPTFVNDTFSEDFNGTQSTVVNDTFSEDFNDTQLSNPTVVNDIFSEDFNDTQLSNPTVVNDIFSKDFNDTQLSDPTVVNDTFSEAFNDTQFNNSTLFNDTFSPVHGTQLGDPDLFHDTFPTDLHVPKFSGSTLVNDTFPQDLHGTQLGDPTLMNDTSSQDLHGTQFSDSTLVNDTHPDDSQADASVTEKSPVTKHADPAPAATAAPMVTAAPIATAAPLATAAPMVTTAPMVAYSPVTIDDLPTSQQNLAATRVIPPKYPTFQNKFQTGEDAKAHRKQVRHGGKKDPNVAYVRQHGRAYWVERIYNSMINIDQVEDGEKSTHYDRFVMRKSFDPDDVEATAHHVFDKALAVHEKGWTRYTIYHKKAVRGALIDRAASNVELRLQRICQLLRGNKSLVNDALQGGLTLAHLCDNPYARAGTKSQNNKGNRVRGERLQAGRNLLEKKQKETAGQSTTPSSAGAEE